MEIQRDLVIKVKYGDSLKRFNASVNGNDLDQDIARLRSKIIQAFDLSPSDDFILTYTDIDGDTVMLDDDEDLRDAAINQQLNPLRITVQLKSKSNGSPATEPKLKATNPTSPSPLDSLNSSLEEALKSLPVPLNSAISKVTGDILAKAMSQPVLTELISAISKAAAPQNSQPVNIPAGGSSTSASGAKGTAPKVPSNPSQESSAVEINNVPVSSGNGAKRNGTSSDKATNENNDTDRKTAFEARCKGKAVMQNAPIKIPFCGGLQPSPQPIPSYHPFTFPRFTPLPAPPPPPHPADFHSDNAFLNGANASTPSSDIPPYPSRFFPSGHPYRKADGYDNMFQACHRGVACDGCDMTPIVGPRYKSIVKDDYDLCVACFSLIGKESDYTKIDRPIPHRMIRDFHTHPKFHVPPLSCPMRQKCRSKLESRFIQDVTVLDGTMMAPLTPFTKIWRMRNNGSMVWPFGTQLIRVGGDQFSSQNSVQLEIPVNGFPVDGEVDIAVDFCAPARAGRYISYWRVASPSGQKFGQRVWVLIQVEQPNNTEQGKSTINLNLPPENCGPDGTDTVELTELQNNPELTVETATPDIEPSFGENQAQASERNTAAVNGLNSPVFPTVSYPLIDLSPPSNNASTAPSAPAVEPVFNGEEVLLKELEEMGFRQVDLNKEVLRLNRYDLEQSVEDLCGFSEWDPLLDELKEMGFDDKETNKKLLVKNGGSIKRVVMDLIAGEKGE